MFTGEGNNSLFPSLLQLSEQLSAVVRERDSLREQVNRVRVLCLLCSSNLPLLSHSVLCMYSFSNSLNSSLAYTHFLTTYLPPSLCPSLPPSSTLLPQLRKELDAFDPSFFEEVEDLKYNYQEAVRRNVQYEEQISTLSQQLGVAPSTFDT